MRKHFIHVLIFSSLFSTLGFSATKKPIKKKVQDETNLRQEMNQISHKIRELGPMIASDLEFIKESNKPIIIKNLSDIQSRFKNLKKHPAIELEGLTINQVIMSEELKDVVHLVEKGKAIQGRAKLLSTLNLCVSCHSQSPGMQNAKLFSDDDMTRFKINGFEKAELFFVSRDYEKAMNLYNEFLSAAKKTDDDEMILKAIERQLIYFVKIKKDFTLGKNYFEGLVKLNKFSESVQKEMNDWVKMLSNKPLWENYDPKLVKEEEMDKFMKKFIADDEEGPIFTTTDSSEVYDLNLSTILLDYYNAHPETKLGGRILYWLAILDKRLNDDLYFSIGDFYLLTCMEKYSKDPIAKECYESYVEDLQINLITQTPKSPNSSKVKTEKEKNEAQRINDLKAKMARLKKLVDYKDEEENEGE